MVRRRVEMVLIDKDSLKDALKNIKETSKKRKFKQKIDLIINLKGLDLKKPEQQVELYVQLHHPKGKRIKVCALVGPELKEEAEKNCDKTIAVDDFTEYQKDKRIVKRLAEEFDFFIAQATIMPKVAQVFGKFLGSRGKMPNPKAGCVVPPKTALKPLCDRLQYTAVLKAKVQQVIKCTVGEEGQEEEQVVDNVFTIYNALIHKLPQEENNIKDVLIKLTMGKPVEVK
jgi:large subunit ribosomal protein L1